MHQRCGGDESVALRWWIRDMQRRAAQRNWEIDGKNAAGECGQNKPLNPFPERFSLGWITPFQPKTADFKLQNGDGRQKKA